LRAIPGKGTTGKGCNETARTSRARTRQDPSQGSSRGGDQKDGSYSEGKEGLRRRKWLIYEAERGGVKLSGARGDVAPSEGEKDASGKKEQCDLSEVEGEKKT